jgi:uncharacterized membrane protein YqjE
MQDAAENTPTAPCLSKVGSAGLGLLQGHIELLGLELQELKNNHLKALALTALAIVSGMLLLIGISALLLVLVWDDYGIQGIAGLSLVYVLLLLLSLYQLRKLLSMAANPFSATLSELARDRERLVP